MLRGVSTSELERRWKAVREVMKEQEIDYLVIQNSEDFLGGTIRWFTDFAAHNQFPSTVIFPVDGEMTTINNGGEPPSEQSPPPWAARGIKNRLGGVYFPTAQYTNTLEAELAVGVLKEKKKPTIGLVEKAFIPLSFYEYLVKHLPEARFVDATEWVEEIKVPKSPEEIESIKATAALQDQAVEHLKKTIRPGMKDFQVAAEAQYFFLRNGSDRQIAMVGSGPSGTPVHFLPYRFGNRAIRKGDQITVLMETNGPEGYYAEIMRCFMIGQKPSQELQDAHAAAVEAQAMNVERLRPGTDPKDLWNMTNAFLKKKAYLPNLRLYAHGQGLSLVERPLIWHKEPWKLKTGMNIAVHPVARAVTQTVSACICDNWIVGENGAGDCLHKTPKEIIVID
jgi:Xaa-Pro aminopeptidase